MQTLFNQKGCLILKKTYIHSDENVSKQNFLKKKAY